MGQQIPEAAQTVFPEQVDLVEHGFLVQDFGQSGGEHSVPEQRNFFLQRARASIAVHPIHSLGESAFDVAAFLPVDVIPLDNIFIQPWLNLGMQQPFHRCGVAPRAVGFQLGRRGAKASPTQQVGKQGAVGILAAK